MSDDISAETIHKTQKVLGKYVKKPPLTEKLLKKPPFRFLHDVIRTVIKETGFLKGLFTEDELKSENVAEKDAKIAFLNKLITAVKIITRTDLAIRASKVVAGLEPTNTNLLLQAIGKAVDAKIDSFEYVSKLKPEKRVINDKKTKTKVSTSSKSSSRTSLDKEKQNAMKTKRGQDNSKNKGKSDVIKKLDPDKDFKHKTSYTKQEDSKERNRNEPERPIASGNTNDKTNTAVKQEEKDSDDLKCDVPTETSSSKEPLHEQSQDEVDLSEKKKDGLIQIDDKDSNYTVIRPKSAKHKSKEITRAERSKPLKATADVSETVGIESMRPPSSSVANRSFTGSELLRPPSVRPSSARPGAPRLRPDSALPMREPISMAGVKVIIENADSLQAASHEDDDDEATVVVENVDISGIKHEEEVQNVEVPLENKGHLVEQILEQIQDGEGKKKIDWEYDSHVKDVVTKELSTLRTLIQNVTKTTSPLGKLINYLHEDIDAMYSELEMWTNTRKQLYSEIKKKKKLNDESMKPIIENLNQLQEDIKKQQQEILSIQSIIIRNDLRIKELLSK